jgi:uncharacterized protein (DUF2267 family)
MTRKHVGIVLLIALGIVAVGRQASAQQPSLRGELSRALESSSLSPESKGRLGSKAGELIGAGVAERDVADVIRQGTIRGVQTPELIRLLDVVAEAKRRGLPPGPVVDKIKEGLAKRVPPERIASVASRITGDLAGARDLVSRAEQAGVRVEAPGDRERAVEAVADVLGRGVPPSEVEELAGRIGRSSSRGATMSRLEASAQVTADLVAMGLSPRAASETVGAALARGMNQRDIERLRERLAQELRRGESPEDGAARLREQIHSERPETRGDHDSPDRQGKGRDGIGDGKPGRR